MTRKQKELIDLVERHEPMVIYQLAKRVGRPYRRVYDNIQKFVEKGLVTLERVTINNRASLKVISSDPYYQRLLKLDDMHARTLSLSLPERETLNPIVSATRKLSFILDSHGVIIGGLCANLHGIERFEKVIEFAVDLTATETMELLVQAGIAAKLASSRADGDAWEIAGNCDGITFQMVPAQSMGIQLSDAIEAIGIRIASEKDFISSRCRVGDQQAIHDVAAMALMYKELKWFAMQQAEAHACRKTFDQWLLDETLLSRFGE